MTRRLAWALLGLLPAVLQGAAAGVPPACKTTESAAIRLRFDVTGSGSGIDGRLSGSEYFGLELRDAHSGALLWTAGAAPGALLQIPGMDADILARPVPVDLDSDGWHDRIYAADVAGRIWRIDLTHGVAREDWARAQQLADLSGDGVRGFLAPPDIALHDTQARVPWLSIALGSVSLEGRPAANRFYVLRDPATPAGRDSAPDRPVVDADLLLAEGTSGIGTLRDEEPLRGYYLPLGAAQVLAPSLTVGGVVIFTVARLASSQAGGCAALASGVGARIDVRAIAAADGSLAFDLNLDGQKDALDAALTLDGVRRPDSELHIASQDDADTPGQRSCRVGTDPIPGCMLDTRLRRRYWLREDAD